MRSLRVFAFAGLGFALGLAACASDTEKATDGDEIHTEDNDASKVGAGQVRTSAGILDIETQYLPRVVEGEIAGVTSSPEALKAQAVAARTYLLRQMKDRPGLGTTTSVPCGPSFQACASTASAASKAAVAATKGETVTFQGALITGNYDAGAHADTDGTPLPPSHYGYSIASWAAARTKVKSLMNAGHSVDSAVHSVLPGGKDAISWTEIYVTDNDGLAGDAVSPTLQDWGASANRGAMSQWGAVGLASGGKTYREILRFYYGADVAIGSDPAQAGNASTDPPPASTGTTPPTSTSTPPADTTTPPTSTSTPPTGTTTPPPSSDGCAPITFPSGVTLVTKADATMSAEYAALGTDCSTPKCFLDVDDLRSPDGTTHDVHVMVGQHFELYEMVSTEIDQGYSRLVLVDPQTIALLDKERNDYGGAVVITSGFRSPEHQRAVCHSVCGKDQCTDSSGAVTCAKNSRHMWGAAADMDLKYEHAADEAGFPFVYHENGGTGPHLHVDRQACE